MKRISMKNIYKYEIKKIVYSHDVVFREVKTIQKQEIQPREEELETIEFKLEDEESNSTKEDEPDKEDPTTLVLRRLVWERRQPQRNTLPDFCSSIVLSIIA
jgi:hypothetical protein